MKNMTPGHVSLARILMLMLRKARDIGTGDGGTRRASPRRFKRASKIWFCTLLVVFPVLPAYAQVERLEHRIVPTGLRAAFPADYGCAPIASPFASSTRYDGSQRLDARNGGLHGGIDLSLETGTPLLAIADGEIIALGEGGALEGIYIWLRHAPKDTATNYFVFSKYQHLAALPTRKVGERVKAGEAIAVSGATGTAGKHFGRNGYPHLHLSTFYGPSEEFEVRGMFGSMVRARDAQLDDPLILYFENAPDLAALRNIPDEQKTVRPGVVNEAGRIHPEGRKAVWPVPCQTLTKG